MSETAPRAGRPETPSPRCPYCGGETRRERREFRRVFDTGTRLLGLVPYAATVNVEVCAECGECSMSPLSGARLDLAGMSAALDKLIELEKGGWTPGQEPPTVS